MLSGSQQLRRRQKERLMRRALKYGHRWLTSVGRGWLEREIYNARDLPQRGEGSRWRSWWVRLDGSSFPRIVRPSSPVFLAPTRSSLMPEQTVASSKRSSWARSLKIHCNGFARPRSHPSMGPVRKSRPYNNHLNKINTRTNVLNIKIKLKNKFSFRCTNTIDILILNLE